MRELLFVCTGNLCRSPMAEAIFNSYGPEGWVASSAGIYAFEGSEPSKFAIDVMDQDYGIDISEHRSKMITEADVADAELVMCMTSEHRDVLVSLYPKFAGKIFTLKRYNDPKTKNDGIADPYGFSMKIYVECAEEIKAEVEKLIKKLD